MSRSLPNVQTFTASMVADGGGEGTEVDTVAAIGAEEEVIAHTAAVEGKMGC